MDDKNKFDVFIKGRFIYLRKPDIQADVYDGEWHSWFNDMKITKYLVHGIFPVSREEEAKIVQEEIDNPSTLLLSIGDVKSDRHIGIISLKAIDLLNRTAEIAIVMGVEKFGAALEAMALLTEHAFERLNLNRLYAGQHEDLWKWVNSLALIGYKIEGYRRHGGIRGRAYDTVLTGITAEDYFRLKKERGTSLLTETPENLFKKRRKENLLPTVKAFFDSLYL